MLSATSPQKMIAAFDFTYLLLGGFFISAGQKLEVDDYINQSFFDPATTQA